MAQNRLITDLVELVKPNNDDLLVIVDNTTSPSLSVTKKIKYSSLIEDLQDMVDLFVQDGTGISAVYSDVGNTLTISVVPDTTVQRTIVSTGGTTVGTRRQLNVIPGAGITLTGADNPSDNRVDLTVNTTAVATGITLSGTGSPVSPLGSITTLGNGTRQLDFRGIKAGSGRLSVNTSDGGNSIVVDVVPSGININELNVDAPLAVALGGTNATTAETARGNLGAAKLGVNDDITSIVGLTTPLSVAQGGTNASTSQAALRTLEGLRTVANVGSAGQSLVVNASTLVSNSYRAELKGIRAGSSRITVSTVGNDISIDANAALILNSASEDVNVNNNKITGLADPSASSDAANKAYVDAVAQGLVVKEAVAFATTANQVGTYSASGLTFTYTATGAPSIDSVSVTATGTRVLFKNQSTGSQNGIYTLTTAGNIGVNPVFTRAGDYNSSLEASAGSFAFVLSGVTNANKQFVQTTTSPTLDTDPLVFTILNDLSIANSSVTNAKLADMSALRIKGTVTSGVPQDLTADQLITIVNSGGTSQIDAARVNLPSVTGDVVINASGVSAISSGVIVNNDISASAEIAVSKLADGTARQLLQTSADGNNVEWASDIVIPGSFVAAGAATFSGSTTFAGATVFNTTISANVSGNVTGNLTGIASAIADSVVTDAKVASNAAIALTKLGSGELPSGITVATANIVSGTIVNEDINSAAAIAHSKLANIAAGSVLLGNASNVPTATVVSGDVIISSAGVTAISSGVIVDADINASAAIADSKLATISGAGKVSNSATTATSNNTANAIVARDASGNFTAGTITATLIGNASTVTTNANLTGDVTSSGNVTAIAAGVIVDADINASAAIAGSKISPDFGSQNIVTSGSSTAASFSPVGSSTPANGIFLPTANTVGLASNSIERVRWGTGEVAFNDAGNNYDFRIEGDTNSSLFFLDASADRIGFGTNTPASTHDLSGNFAQNIVAVAALNIDCSTGNYFTKTINANSTFTVSNVPASRSYSFTLELTHTSGAITWFSGVEWPNGSAPSLTTGKTHLFMFITDDGGTRWRGAALTNYTN